MKRFTLIIILLILSYTSNIKADEIKFPPELLWWINEIKKVNAKVDLNSFVFSDKRTEKIENIRNGWHLLIYPVFMRWNYSGNYVAYYNYHETTLHRRKSGKYFVGDFDDLGTLLIANRDKTIFFIDYFGLHRGLHSIHWLTDTVLVGVGIEYIDEYVDLYIKNYRINISNNTVEISTYICKNALKNDDRLLLKLDWFEQRPDYFEIE